MLCILNFIYIYNYILHIYNIILICKVFVNLVSTFVLSLLTNPICYEIVTY